MSAPENVEAEILEPVNLTKAPEPAIEYTLPTATVGNLGSIEKYVSDMEAFFAGVQIDVTDNDQVKQLKGMRADINKIARAIDDGRKAMDRDVKSAIGDADRALNGLRDRVKAVYDATGKQIEEADALQRKARMNLLEREYEAIAPDLMALVPLSSFIAREPKLAQKSWGGTKACDALGEMVADAVHDRARIMDGDVEFSTEADMVYCRTLDLRKALDENDRLKRERDAREAHEQDAAKLEAAVGKAHEPVAEESRSAAAPVQPEPARGPQEARDETRTWRLEFSATRIDAEKVRDYIKTIPGIAGKSFKAVKDGGHE